MAATSSTVAETPIGDRTESASRDEVQAIQVERLRKTVAQVAEVPFYKAAFAERGITPESIRTLDDLQKLPLTTKQDLREHYPLGFLAVPRAEVMRFHGSSGTTGKPTFVAYTREDLETWAGLCARFLVAGGLRPEHVVQIAFGYGLFTGGFGLHYGVERVGASIIPAASGNTPRQLMLLRDMQVDALVCTPSYALNIAETALAEGIDLAACGLKYAYFGGEPWTEDMRVTIENDMGIQAFNNYGLSEVIGPGVSGECMARTGMHIQDDHFIVECIDPETLEPVAEGEPGELVFTSLTKQAMPIIRYRTRDIATLDRTLCACGRTTTRMSRVIGRTDDMLIIRGANVYPSQIEEALLKVEGVAPHYLIEVDRPGAMDVARVQVEMRPECFSDRIDEMQALRKRLEHEIRVVTTVSLQVDLVRPGTLERSVGKAQRVLDHRREKGLI